LLVLVTLGGATAWTFIYTGWSAAITACGGLFILYAGTIVATFFRKKDNPIAVSPGILKSPLWLLIPAIFLVLWIVSLFWATIELRVLDEHFKSVVSVQPLGDATGGRQEAPSQSAAVKIRVPLWRTQAYYVSTDLLTARLFGLSRWHVNRIFLPDELLRWQIYFKATPALVKTVAKYTCRLRLVRGGKGIGGVDPYRGEGIVVGGDDGSSVEPPKDSSIKFVASALTLQPHDIVEAIVEYRNATSGWSKYTATAASPAAKRGTREVELDAPH
jgi:hypothetical protein